MTDDAALVISLKEGSPAAYDLLYERYWKVLYEKAYSRITDRDAAKDVVQQVFISIWVNRDNLSISTGLQPYLFGAVKLQVLNYFRSEQVRERILSKAMAHMELIVESMDELLPYEVMDESLALALEGMPENMKQSFLLRCDNLSIREIAEKLNLAEQTVSNNLSEAVKRLRQKLANGHSGGYMMAIALFLSLINK